MSNYACYLVHKCGWFEAPSFGNVWFLNGRYDGVCPKCGATMPSESYQCGGEWELVTARPVKVRDGFLRSHIELQRRDDKGEVEQR